MHTNPQTIDSDGFQKAPFSRSSLVRLACVLKFVNYEERVGQDLFSRIENAGLKWAEVHTGEKNDNFKPSGRVVSVYRNRYY